MTIFNNQAISGSLIVSKKVTAGEFYGSGSNIVGVVTASHALTAATVLGTTVPSGSLNVSGTLTVNGAAVALASTVYTKTEADARFSTASIGALDTTAGDARYIRAFSSAQSITGSLNVSGTVAQNGIPVVLSGSVYSKAQVDAIVGSVVGLTTSSADVRYAFSGSSYSKTAADTRFVLSGSVYSMAQTDARILALVQQYLAASSSLYFTGSVVVPTLSYVTLTLATGSITDLGTTTATAVGYSSTSASLNPQPTFTFYSSAPSVATINSSSGAINGQSVGSTVITVSGSLSGSVASATKTLTVVAHATQSAADDLVATFNALPVDATTGERAQILRAWQWDMGRTPGNGVITAWTNYYKSSSLTDATIIGTGSAPGMYANSTVKGLTYVDSGSTTLTGGILAADPLLAEDGHGWLAIRTNAPTGELTYRGYTEEADGTHGASLDAGEFVALNDGNDVLGGDNRQTGFRWSGTPEFIGSVTRAGGAKTGFKEALIGRDGSAVAFMQNTQRTGSRVAYFGPHNGSNANNTPRTQVDHWWAQVRGVPTKAQRALLVQYSQTAFGASNSRYSRPLLLTAGNSIMAIVGANINSTTALNAAGFDVTNHGSSGISYTVDQTGSDAGTLFGMNDRFPYLEAQLDLSARSKIVDAPYEYVNAGGSLTAAQNYAAIKAYATRLKALSPSSSVLFVSPMPWSGHLQMAIDIRALGIADLGTFWDGHCDWWSAVTNNGSIDPTIDTNILYDGVRPTAVTVETKLMPELRRAALAAVQGPIAAVGTPSRLMYDLSVAGYSRGADAFVYDVRYGRVAGSGSGVAALNDALGRNGWPAFAAPDVATQPVLSGTSNTDYLLNVAGDARFLQTVPDARVDPSLENVALVFAGTSQNQFVANIQKSDFAQGGIFLGVNQNDAIRWVPTDTTDAKFIASTGSSGATTRRAYVVQSFKNNGFGVSVLPHAPGAQPTLTGPSGDYHLPPYATSSASGSEYFMSFGRLSSTNSSNASLRFQAAFPGGLTGAQLKVLNDWLVTAHTIEQSTPINGVTFMGDSITDGAASTFHETGSYRALLAARASTNGAIVSKLAQSGRTLASMAVDLRNGLASALSTAGARNVLSIMGGINDMIFHGATSSSIATDTVDIITKWVQETPNNVVLYLPMLPVDPVAFSNYSPSIRTAVESTVRTAIAALPLSQRNRVFVPNTSGSAIYTEGYMTSGSAKSSDGIHPNDAGHAEFAAFVGPTYDAAFGYVSVNTPLPLSVAVTPSNTTVIAGATQQYTATATSASVTLTNYSASAFSWSVSPSNAGNISGVGLFTASTASLGAYTIIAIASGSTVSGSTGGTIVTASTNGFIAPNNTGSVMFDPSVYADTTAMKAALPTNINNISGSLTTGISSVSSTIASGVNTLNSASLVTSGSTKFLNLHYPGSGSANAATDTAALSINQAFPNAHGTTDLWHRREIKFLPKPGDGTPFDLNGQPGAVNSAAYKLFRFLWIGWDFAVTTEFTGGTFFSFGTGLKDQRYDLPDAQRYQLATYYNNSTAGSIGNMFDGNVHTVTVHAVQVSQSAQRLRLWKDDVLMADYTQWFTGSGAPSAVPLLQTVTGPLNLNRIPVSGGLDIQYGRIETVDGELISDPFGLGGIVGSRVRTWTTGSYNGITPIGATPTPDTVTVTPANAIVSQSLTQQYTATATSASVTLTNYSASAFSWSVAPNVGTISSTGLLTIGAAATGSYVVTAAASGSTVTGSTAGSIVAQQVYGAPTAVTLLPANATVLQNGTLQYTASATSASVTIPAYNTQTAYSWSLAPGTAGTISQAGLFTASPTNSGSYTITAVASGSAASASVTGTINGIVINGPGLTGLAGKSDNFTTYADTAALRASAKYNNGNSNTTSVDLDAVDTYTPATGSTHPTMRFNFTSGSGTFGMMSSKFGSGSSMWVRTVLKTDANFALNTGASSRMDVLSHGYDALNANNGGGITFVFYPTGSANTVKVGARALLTGVTATSDTILTSIASIPTNVWTEFITHYDNTTGVVDWYVIPSGSATRTKAATATMTVTSGSLPAMQNISFDAYVSNPFPVSTALEVGNWEVVVIGKPEASGSTNPFNVT